MPPSTMPRTIRTSIVAAAFVLLIGACSSGSSNSSPGGDESSGEPVPADCDPARPANPGTDDRVFDHGGTERDYALSVPDGYTGEAEVPMIVNLHGLSSTIDEQDAVSDFPHRAGDRGYVVVTPQALPVALPVGENGALEEALFWNMAAATSQGDTALDADDDTGFIEQLVASVEDELCIDPGRLFVSGLSNGAGMTMALACDPDSRFAAAAPVAGVNMTNVCPAPGPVSTVAFHGDVDDAVDYAGGNVAGFDLGNPGVEERMNELAAVGGCDDTATVERPFDDVEVRTWENCTDGTDVVLYTVVGGGHTWPGFTTYYDEPVDAEGQTTSIIATDEILDFFDAHSAPTG